LFALALMLLCQICVAQAGDSLSGTVRDTSGAVVTGAQVTLRDGARSIRRTTASDGAFSFPGLPAAGATLSVQAAGFAPYERPVDGGERSVEVVLAPARLLQQVTVTAARGVASLAETAAAVAILPRAQLDVTAAPALDDALRQVAGFSLFRRSGSRTANPTAQGVSLRGVGASGASRAVVLFDGVPLNDPFGGWVYWGRVPLESVASMEVLQGGASQLYGSDALGGVVQILGRRSPMPTGSLQASYGSQNTAVGSAFGTLPVAGWMLSGSGELFHTDGYVIVDEAERGPVDTAAGSEHKTAEARLEHVLGGGLFFARGGFYHESRRNGTQAQRNRTRVGQGVLGADVHTPHNGVLALRFYGSGQQFDQTFTAVAADRASERLTRSQHVPAQQLGYTAQWRGSFRAHSVLAGLDGRQVRGHSDEIIFGATGPTSNVDAGGRERALGFFAQDSVRLAPRWLLTVGLRVDRWHVHNGLATTTPLAAPGPPVRTDFPDRSETAASPHIALLHHVNDNVAVSVAGYRSFRSPTLNELYRSFRVGNVLTLANEELRAERLAGGEAGVRIAPHGERVALRGEFFWSEMTRPVANVTLSATPSLITRQRQNLGRTRALGFAVAAEVRAKSLVFSGGYQFADATVLRFPVNTTLEGLRIPQTPRHQFTVQMRYTGPQRVNVGVQARFGGEQFDDDQNQFALERFFTVDVLASRALREGVELFVAGENVFDQRYAIGRTPVRTVASPAQFRAGVRLRLGAR
jgi:outer membrane receptor protein involved in Fe transport